MRRWPPKTPQCLLQLRAPASRQLPMQSPAGGGIGGSRGRGPSTARPFLDRLLMDSVNAHAVVVIDGAAGVAQRSASVGMGRIAAKGGRFAVLDGHDPTACLRAIRRARATDLSVTGPSWHLLRSPHSDARRKWQ